jgi:hypothetical protein
MRKNEKFQSDFCFQKTLNLFHLKFVLVILSEKLKTDQNFELLFSK